MPVVGDLAIQVWVPLVAANAPPSGAENVAASAQPSGAENVAASSREPLHSIGWAPRNMELR